MTDVASAASAASDPTSPAQTRSGQSPTALRVAPPEADRPVAPKPVAPAGVSRRPSRRDVIAIVGVGLTVLGVVVAVYVAYLVLLSGLGHDSDQRALSTTFQQQLDFAQAPIGAPIAEGAPIAVLDVPTLGLREVVVEGTSGMLLRKGPGHLRTSSIPGQPGNAVIAGRRVAYGGPFRNIGRLDQGDRINVSTGQGVAVYEVDETREIDGDDADVLDNGEGNTLTLMTSAPALLADHRLVAVATLRTPAQPSFPGRPTEVRTEELGLHADRSSAIALLVWAQALLAAAMGTAWLYRRWSRWPTWLVTTPVLALLVLLVFDSFTPVLPSTL